ncbi:MAG: exo-alpha-sialidase, partial [candidate division WOR-3 bacterium]
MLYYKKSTDDGFTWSNEISISLPTELVIGESRNISIACRGGYLYVAYAVAEDETYAVMFCRSTDNGTTWGGHKTIAHSLLTFPRPSITVAEDSVRVVYCEFHYDVFNYTDLVYAASGDNGNTWHSYDHINFPAPKNLQWPDITTVNNRPHI